MAFAGKLIRITVLAMSALCIGGCLENSSLDINSQGNYDKQGLSITAETVPLGGVSRVRVSLNYVTPRDVTFHAETRSVNATDGFDYLAISKDFKIPSGKTYVDIPLTSFRQNVTPADRVVEVMLTGIDGAPVAGSTTATAVFKGNAGSTPLVGARSVVSSQSATCIVGDDYRIYCWGSDVSAIASGTGTISTTPKLKTLIPGVQSNPIKIVSGNVSVCALYSSGMVMCWGTNPSQSISTDAGFGSTFVAPQSILSSTGKAAIDLAMGWTHTCVVYADGTVGCKGSNSKGELGNGTTTSNYLMQAVSGLGGTAAKVGAAYQSSCAVLTNGAVKCWGDNTYGTLANGALGGSSTTAQTSLITTGAVQISGGQSHYCALLSTGAVYCWGRNSYGQLGFGNFGADTGTPGLVALPAAAVQISVANSSSCALLATGEIYCWGSNYLGQLGDFTVTDRTVPVKVLGLPDKARSVTVGAANACALFEADTRLYCWGDNSQAQATNYSTHLTYPSDVDQLVGKKVTDISITTQGSNPLTNQFGCAVLDNGEADCWGFNISGNTGIGSTSIYASLTQVLGHGAGLVSSIKTGLNFACSLFIAGGMNCWGGGYNEPLGDGVTRTSASSVPSPVVPVGMSTGVKQIAGSTYHTCALMNDGTVKCWGEMEYATSSHASCYQNTPTLVTGLSAIQQIEVSAGVSCALDSAGKIKCWGINSNGQFGNGLVDPTCTMTPSQVSGSGVFKKFALGGSHACAISVDGRVFCWGSNAFGALGRAQSQNFLSPVEITGLGENAIDVAVGEMHSCVLLEDGGVRCWGDDSLYQLGLNRSHSATYYSPITPLGLNSGVKAIKANAFTTCAITIEGYAKCWGHNGGGINRIGSALLPFPREVLDVRASN